MVAALFFIGYLFFLRKVPKPTGMVSEGGRKAVAKMLLRSLWSIILIVALIIAFDIPVYIATPLVAVLNVFVDRLKPWEIKPMFRTAFEPVIIFNTVLIMMFKDIITSRPGARSMNCPFFLAACPFPCPWCLRLIFFLSGPSSAVPMPSFRCVCPWPWRPCRRAGVPAAGAAHEFRLCGHAGMPYPCMPVHCRRVL